MRYGTSACATTNAEMARSICLRLQKQSALYMYYLFHLYHLYHLYADLRSLTDQPA